MVVSYGAMANKWFPLFNEDMAAAITGNGRFFIQKTANMVEQKLQELHPSQKQYIVYGDTDSFYFQIEPFMEHFILKNPGLSMNEYVDFADKFEKKVIQPIIQKSIDEFAHALNAYNKDKIGCEREIISDCVAPNTQIRIKRNGKTKILSISKFAKMFGINTIDKKEYIKDISDYNVEILSYNTTTNQKETKRVLNIQKKITSKKMLTLTAPNGKSITVTEDHKLAIRTNNGIAFKEARLITEDDDVEFFDNTYYTKENQELYGIQYINHGSEHADLKEKGKKISKSKRKTKLSRIENESLLFNKRVEQLIKRYNGKLLKFILKYCHVPFKNKTKQQILNYISNHNILKRMDISLIKYMYNKTNYNLIKRYCLIKKYGKTYFKKIANHQRKNKNGFVRLQSRIQVITRKKIRKTKSSPLHTAKHQYRVDVGRITKQSIKEHGLLNVELVDKYNFNVDHIVPIMYGFHNGIPPEIIGDIRNLQVISKIKNIKKRCKIDYNIIDMNLFANYIEG